MNEIPCPECQGKCCRDSYRYKLTHMGDEFYEHVCEACYDGTKPQALATTTLDLAALRKKLREYDKDVPRCPITRQKEVSWDDFSGYQTVTCCRPEGHEGECRNSRLVLGWPGYEVIKELIRLAEIATNATT